MGLSKNQERDYAKMLYTTERLTVKEIAERVKCNEKTVGRWVKVGEWETLRKTMLTTKQHMISQLYDQLEFMNSDINKREIKVASTKEADIILKLSAAIQRMEVETSVGVIVEVARDVLNFIREQNVEHSQLMTKYFDQFIQLKLK